MCWFLEFRQDCSKGKKVGNRPRQLFELWRNIFGEALRYSVIEATIMCYTRFKICGLLDREIEPFCVPAASMRIVQASTESEGK